MPSRPNASKRKATVSVKDQASSKAARPGISSDAPTSKRQAPTNELAGTQKENVGVPTTREPTSRRAVQPNCGQGGHAYQLENALNPIMRDQTAKKNDGIPETIPENAMAPPQALRKNRKQDSNTKVTTALKLPRSAAMLPQADNNSQMGNATLPSTQTGTNCDCNNRKDHGQRLQANSQSQSQFNLIHNCNTAVPGITETDGDDNDGDGDEDGNDDDDNNSYSYSDDGRGESNSSNVQTYRSDSDEDIYASCEPSPRPDINMDIEIDNAAAQAALHYSQDKLPNPDNEDHDIDVVEDHRAHNRFEDDVNLDNKCTTEQNGETDNDEDNESSTGRARRYSKTPRDAEPKPITMKYYPPGWQAMLETAKNNMRRHVALVNAFPRRKTDLKQATLILTNTIAEYQMVADNVLEPDMSILVFNEHSTFCQKLKRVAQQIISLKYTNLLCPPEFEGGNQQEEYDLVIHAVNEALTQGRFLRGREDENGKCKNIAHPAISTTIHQFFYADNDCLANLFPEDFEQTIPDHVIALIQNCLEEYVDFGYKKRIPLDGDKYRAVMKQHLTLIDTLKGHQYHGAQYESRRAGWARKGM
ncbi:hypothetical protein BYT27DRAFT_7337869 [Phlegmacium glaucopus]|nr:hypothetical protein BYT27DRAFT_7337869 [Phlegmacium glaucopus]